MVCAFQVEETVMMGYHQYFNPRLLPTFSIVRRSLSEGELCRFRSTGITIS
jgi:hypothetical protein